MFGFVSIAVTIATHTAKQQLFHCPNVSVLKQRRKSMSEVDEPDIAVDSGDKFLSKSFLRKVGNIQEQKRTVLVVTSFPHHITDIISDIVDNSFSCMQAQESRNTEFGWRSTKPQLMYQIDSCISHHIVNNSYYQ